MRILFEKQLASRRTTIQPAVWMHPRAKPYHSSATASAPTGLVPVERGLMHYSAGLGAPSAPTGLVPVERGLMHYTGGGSGRNVGQCQSPRSTGTSRQV